MEAVLAGEEAGLTLKEQTILLVFLDHCFNSLVCNIIITPYITLTSLRKQKIVSTFIYEHSRSQVYPLVHVNMVWN